MTMLYEKYRPQTWAQYVGHKKAIENVRELIDAPGFSGGAFWIAGGSGMGKTTLGNLIVGQFIDSEFGIEELNGDACNVEAVHEIAQTTRVGRMGGDWRAYVINEAHNMSPKAVQAWLNLLEQMPPKRLVIFTTAKAPTTNLFGDHGSQLLSRCWVTHLESSPEDLADLADRLFSIAQAEGRKADHAACVELLAKWEGNLRRAICELEFDLTLYPREAIVALVKTKKEPVMPSFTECVNKELDGVIDVPKPAVAKKPRGKVVDFVPQIEVLSPVHGEALARRIVDLYHEDKENWNVSGRHVVPGDWYFDSKRNSKVVLLRVQKCADKNRRLFTCIEVNTGAEFSAKIFPSNRNRVLIGWAA